MKKLLVVPLLLFGAAFGDEITAYKTGFVDGFRVGVELKEPKRVTVPSGYWLYIPTKNLPTEAIAFYVFAGKREGFDPVITDDAVVLKVFSRKADALFWKERLEAKGIRAYVDWREGTEGMKGYVYRIVYDTPKKGVEGVEFHLRKAIERAKEIDPTVFNRDLLIRDLQTILGEIEKWREERKGYTGYFTEKKPKAEVKKERAEERAIKEFLRDD